MVGHHALGRHEDFVKLLQRSSRLGGVIFDAFTHDARSHRDTMTKTIQGQAFNTQIPCWRSIEMTHKTLFPGNCEVAVFLRCLRQGWTV